MKPESRPHALIDTWPLEHRNSAAINGDEKCNKVTADYRNVIIALIPVSAVKAYQLKAGNGQNWFEWTRISREQTWCRRSFTTKEKKRKNNKTHCLQVNLELSGHNWHDASTFKQCLSSVRKFDLGICHAELFWFRLFLSSVSIKCPLLKCVFMSYHFTFLNAISVFRTDVPAQYWGKKVCCSCRYTDTSG